MRASVLCAAAIISFLSVLNKSPVADVFAAAGIGVILTLLAVQAGKRLHDWGSSAGWVFVMITGGGALILPLMLAFKPGPNRFGDRAPTSKAMKIAAWASGVLILAAVCTWMIVAMISAAQQPEVTPSASATPVVGTRSTTSQGTASTPASSPQIVRGTVMGYSVTVPAGWNVKGKAQLSTAEWKDFDLVLSHDNHFIAVVAEEGDLGSPDVVVDLTQTFSRKNMNAARFSDATPILINGRSWRAFTGHAAIQNIPLAFQYYVYTGPEGTFQLIGWTVENLFERDANAMRNVMRSFTFPP